MRLCLLGLFCLCLIASCKTENSLSTEQRIQEYTIQNSKGMFAKLTNYGGIIMELYVPEKGGGFRDVVLGFDSPEDYLKDHPYFGAIIGRYGNRIAEGSFAIDNQKFELPQNDGTNTLHGGYNGFDKQVWEVVYHNNNEISLAHVSPDGAEGFPGMVKATVTYSISETNELIITYTATTDKPTVLNLTNHSYFNLNGAGSKDILGHTLFIDADLYNAIDSLLIPIGEPSPVENTPFDFRIPKTIGSRIRSEYPQIKIANGYDHNYVLNKEKESMKNIGIVTSNDGRVVMEIHTTEPGIQLYTGNFLDVSGGKLGSNYGPYSGFCLETQHFPNSPNRPDFPTTLLRPGEIYSSQTKYIFKASDL